MLSTGFALTAPVPGCADPDTATEMASGGHARKRTPPLDATEPPRIVFEAPAACRDGEGAGQALRTGLAGARAPSSGWTLTLRVDAAGTHLRATSELSDASGAPVAHRELSEATSDCSGLARAVGVWAGLVLDAEI